ncbi:hypothetical protein AAFF_G00415480 [Aldrovandia affinis]|uniref:Uncharacterized protein n=1 Tax=Aldrovandia affinis TaxID=143900 RepID=A0AAD7SAV0_9TELE|nr:hypothetical protein AAFF_G00415480 [Aldrovandia affinis]
MEKAREKDFRRSSLHWNKLATSRTKYISCQALRDTGVEGYSGVSPDVRAVGKNATVSIRGTSSSFSRAWRQGGRRLRQKSCDAPPLHQAAQPEVLLQGPVFLVPSSPI